MAFEEQLRRLHADGYLDRAQAAAMLAGTAAGISVLLGVVRDLLAAKDGGRDLAGPVAIEALSGAAESSPALRSTVTDLLAAALRGGGAAGIAWPAATALVELDPGRALTELLAAGERPAAEQDQPSLARGLELLATRDPQTRGRLLEPLTRLLRSEDDLARSAAARGLAMIDDDRAFDALLRRVEDAPQDHHAVVDALLRSPRASARSGDLIRALAEVVDSGSGQAWSAASSLTRLDGGRPVLLDMAERPGQQTPVIMALAEAGERAAVPMLLRKLESEPGAEAVVVSALGRLGDPAAVPALARRLADGRLGAVPARALRELGDEGLRELVRQFDSPVATARAAVAAALTGPPSAVPMLGVEPAATVGDRLVELLADASDADTARIARILGSLEDASAADALTGLLADDRPAVRLAAVEALGRLPGPAAMDDASRLLEDPVPEVRAAAVRTVAARAPAAAPELARLLRDPEPEVRLAAVQGLAGSAEPDAVGALLGALDDENPRVRVAAAGAMPPAGPDAVARLEDLMVDGDGAGGGAGAGTAAVAVELREAAARSLARSGADGMAAVRRAARSADPSARMAAAAAAEVLADGLAVIDDLLDDPDPAVRRRALRAVPVLAAGVPDRADATPHLWDPLARLLGRRLRSAGPELRPDYGEALVSIAQAPFGPVVAEELVRSLEHPQREVVRTAAASIGASIDRLDAARTPLPGWLRVQRDAYVLHLSPQAQSVVAALESATRREPETAAAASAALGAVGVALARKRTAGAVDLNIMYYEAPSRERDDELLERLADAGRSGPGGVRHLDATFIGSDGVLPAGAALREGETYELEVAVRVTPTGIPAVGGREPFPPVPAEGDAVELLVVAEPGHGITVDEPIATLTLPATGDSTANAVFTVTADVPTSSPAALSELRLRVFYRLNLLESAVIRAEVVSRFRPDVRSQLGLELPVTIEHDRVERGFEELSPDDARALHIDVSRRDPGYALRFTWSDGEGRATSLTGGLPLTAAELSTALSDSRNALLEVTMGTPFATELTPSADQSVQVLTRLARVGRDLHTALFRRKLDSAIARIGTLLASAPPSRDSVVQVSVSPDAADFLFPWGLVYDEALPENAWTAPDPAGFWGERYCIEQRLPGTHRRTRPPVATAGDGARMAFMLWEQFPNAADHVASLEALGSGRGLKVAEPITTASAANDAIGQASATDIFYFYTHAHTREAAGDGVRSIQAALAAMAAGTKEHAALQATFDRVVAERDQPSMITLTHGRLQLPDLYARDVGFTNQPLVFLNACESAQLTPALAGESFVAFFLDRGASAFIGTECTMTVVFAHPFAERLLRELVGGASVGSALLATRRHFLGTGNPLGLAYSLYGNAARTFG